MAREPRPISPALAMQVKGQIESVMKAATQAAAQGLQVLEDRADGAVPAGRAVVLDRQLAVTIDTDVARVLAACNELAAALRISL